MVTDTSMMAYNELVSSGKLGDKQQEVYNALAHLVEASNGELAKYLHWPINTITPRVYELRSFNLVYEVDKRPCTVSGRKAKIWSVCDKMNSFKGKIIDKDTKTQQKKDGSGEYTRTVYTLDGPDGKESFSTFRDHQFKIGDVAFIEYEIKGKYKNLKSITLGDESLLQGIKITEEVVSDEPQHKRGGSLKIKTIEANSPEEFDTKVNEFSSQHKVTATQTHVVAYGDSPTRFQYTAVVYYQ